MATETATDEEVKRTVECILNAQMQYELSRTVNKIMAIKKVFSQTDDSIHNYDVASTALIDAMFSLQDNTFDRCGGIRAAINALRAVDIDMYKLGGSAIEGLSMSGKEAREYLAKGEDEHRHHHGGD